MAGPRQVRPAPVSDLVAARERMGLSRVEASVKARIPPRYLEALETGDHSVFPAGPFLSGYTRQYRAFLKLGDAPLRPLPTDPEPTVTIPSHPGRRSRIHAAQLAVIGGLASLSFLLLIGISREVAGEAEVPVGEPPDQIVRVRVPEPLRASVTGDDRELFAGLLPAGETLTFEAHDRLVIDLESLDEVSLDYNGHSLRPLGATTRKRRLVLIDDLGPR